jgi:hypothetical protein
VSYCSVHLLGMDHIENRFPCIVVMSLRGCVYRLLHRNGSSSTVRIVALPSNGLFAKNLSSWELVYQPGNALTCHNKKLFGHQALTDSFLQVQHNGHLTYCSVKNSISSSARIIWILHFVITLGEVSNINVWKSTVLWDVMPHRLDSVWGFRMRTSKSNITVT